MPIKHEAKQLLSAEAIRVLLSVLELGTGDYQLSRLVAYLLWTRGQLGRAAKLFQEVLTQVGW